MRETKKAKIGDMIRITKVVEGGVYKNGDIGEVAIGHTDAQPSSIYVRFGNSPNAYLVYNEEYEILPQEPPKDYAATVQAERLSDVYPKYYKDVRGIDEIDVYKTHELFGIDDPSGAIHHASKKLLLSGARTGGKSKYDDVREARDTLTRWLDMIEEKDAR